MGFQMPDNVAELNLDQLKELQEKADKAFAELYGKATADGGVPAQEDLDALEELSGHIDTISTHVGDQERAQEERKERADALAQKHQKDAQGEGDGEGEGQEGEGEGQEGEGDGEGEDAQAHQELNQAQDTPEAVAASARRRTNFSGLPNDKNSVPTPKVKGFSMNPHVPGFQAGHVDTLALARSYDQMRSGSNFGNRSNTSTTGATTAMGLGSLARDFPQNLVAKDDRSLQAAIDVATNEKELEGGSLTAAAGWCAPSETLYDFLGIPAASELLSLPEVNIDRGGVRFPIQPDFSALYNDENTSFHYTEAELLDGVEKPCFEIPCDGFEEVRLEAIGLCITAGILQQKGFPEAVQVYIDGILKNHMHRVSAVSVRKMQEGSGEAITIPEASTMGAFGALLNAVEMAIVDLRLNQRIPEATTLEVVLPVWAKAVLRADLTYRRGETATQPVTDAQLAAHFTQRGAVVQYVGEYQSGGQLPGGSTPMTQWPDTIEFMVYPAGTWFRSMSNVIELGVLYDQAQLKNNRYTALFTEDGFAVGKRGPVSRRYQVPIHPNGMVGAAATLADADAGAGV